MREIIKAGLAAALVIGLTGNAFADGRPDTPPPGDMPLSMETMSASGAISKADYLAAAERHFEKLDANGDGIATATEIAAARNAMRPHTADAAPASPDAPPPPPGSGHDGLPPRPRDITKARFLENAERRFEMMDANHDGVLTQEEMKAGHGGFGHKPRHMERPE